MAKPDALSQREDHMLGMEDNNKGMTIISLDRIGALMVYIMDEGDCNNPTNNMKDAALHAECQAIDVEKK